MRRQHRPAYHTLETLLTGFVLELESSHRAPTTIKIYTEAVRILQRHMGDNQVAANVKPEDIQRLMVSLLQRNTPATVHNRYRALRTFWLWAVRAGYVEVSPMASLTPPKLPQHLTPVFSLAELRALVKACEGTAFEDRRDLAVIRLLIDTGMRRAEIGNLTLESVSLRDRTVTVIGKGDKERIIRFGAKSGAALHRYMVDRNLHPSSDSPALWLGLAGAMGPWGIRDILERRGKKAGVPDVHPHRFRHTFAHYWLANGGTEGDLMTITGWTTRQMVSHYAASVASERARACHSTFSPGEMV